MASPSLVEMKARDEPKPKRLHVLLDLDQTLISAETTGEFKAGVTKDPSIKQRQNRFVWHNMDNEYIVFERPGLQDFLTFLFEHFDVSVWTAANLEYAAFIVDKILIGPNHNRHLKYIFVNYHCNVSEKVYNRTKLDQRIKQLPLLWEVFRLHQDFQPDSTFIIDDNPNVYKPQPETCIRAPEFKFFAKTSEKDDFLVVLKEQLRTLDDEARRGQPIGDVIGIMNAQRGGRGRGRR